jgi:hypothetical protein
VLETTVVESTVIEMTGVEMTVIEMTVIEMTVIEMTGVEMTGVEMTGVDHDFIGERTDVLYDASGDDRFRQPTHDTMGASDMDEQEQGRDAGPAPGNDEQSIEDAAREALEHGVDIREEVRALTTAALSQGRLDTERARRVIDAVMDGVTRGATGDAARAREHVEQAAHGVDDALARAAQALQLTAEEARERFESFGEEDLRKAREDLQTLEALLLESARRLAASSDTIMRQVWSDLEQHWRNSGTEVGRQATRAFDEAAEQLRKASTAQLAASWDAALGASAQMTEVASGVLAGIAASLAEHRRDRHGRERRERES